MKSTIVYFDQLADGTPVFNANEVPAVVRFWLYTVREVLQNKAFRFIRYDYPDITVEVRSNPVGHYRYKCVYTLK